MRDCIGPRPAEGRSVLVVAYGIPASSLPQHDTPYLRGRSRERRVRHRGYRTTFLKTDEHSLHSPVDQ